VASAALRSDPLLRVLTAGKRFTVDGPGIWTDADFGKMGAVALLSFARPQRFADAKIPIFAYDYSTRRYPKEPVLDSFSGERITDLTVTIGLTGRLRGRVIDIVPQGVITRAAEAWPTHPFSTSH
jgi:hypothetical protein